MPRSLLPASASWACSSDLSLLSPTLPSCERPSFIPPFIGMRRPGRRADPANLRQTGHFEAKTPKEHDRETGRKSV